MHHENQHNSPLFIKFKHRPLFSSLSSSHPTTLQNSESPMGIKKFFLKVRETSSKSRSSCKNPRTESSRAVDGGEDGCGAIKTVNSVYTDSAEWWFADSSSEDYNYDCCDDDDDAVVRGLRSDRLIFEPGPVSSRVLEGAVVMKGAAVAVGLESEDPYRDFRASMEEMVAANGIREWECLEELLISYLRVNSSKAHGFIVWAFVDLVMGLGSLQCSSSSSQAVAALGSASVSLFEIEEVQDESIGSC